MVVRQQQLHNHTILLAKKIFTAKKLEFPHSHETRIIQGQNPVAVRQEAMAPVSQRIGVMLAHHLKIQQFPATAFGGADQLLD